MELIGPAGAGKTSLFRGLTQDSEKFVQGAQLGARRIAHMPFFVRNGLPLVPLFLRRFQNGRRLTREEIKAMIHLRGWHRVLERQATNGAIIILDHGPVFMSTWLRGFGPENIRSQDFEGWWDRMTKQWARTLDLVIYLDAPDAILLQRVYTRDRWHHMKAISEKAAGEFLAHYRWSYERVISALTLNGGPRVVRLDTSQESISQTVDKVLVAVDSWLAQC